MKFWKLIGGRKFLVLLLATVALMCEKLESWHWVIVAGLYLGMNVLKEFSRQRRAKESK